MSIEIIKEEKSLTKIQKIKIILVCIIMPIGLSIWIIYETVKEYQKDPIFVTSQLLLFFVSIAIFVYFWREHDTDSTE